MSNVKYFVIEKGILTKYMGGGGNVTIPDGVTGIGEGAFAWCESLTNITIPDSVTSIGNDAFQVCKSLTHISLPNSVKTIGAEAFVFCENLTDVIIPEGLESIGNGAFRGCKKLADDDGYVIRNGILFDYFGNSEDVTIPESVVIISGGAFLNNTELRSVNIHEGVKHIGNYAFSRCRNLKTISISNPETSIGYKAFYGCKGLADKKGFVIYKGVLQDYLGSGAVVKIPKGVTEICDSVFSNNEKLTSVTIPDTVTSIGSKAFNNCINLETAVIPDSVRAMGAEVFRSCSRLTAITLPKGLTSIEDSSFDICKSLSSVSIPSSVTAIGERAFGGWCCLSNVSIPESVTHIGEQAFEIKTPVNWVKSPIIPSYSTFPSTGFALLLCGEKKGYYAFTSKSDKDNISDYVKNGRWNQYDMELINNGPDYKYKVPARLIGALGRLLDPVELTDDVKALYIELLNKYAKKLVPIAEESGCVDVIKDLFSLNILDAKTEKAVKKLLAASKSAEIAALADKV